VVPAPWREGKLVIKGGQSIDLAGRQVEMGSYLSDGLPGDVTKLILNSLKNGDQRISLYLWKSLQNPFNTCGMFFHSIGQA
jgi:hypothetical protein